MMNHNAPVSGATPNWLTPAAIRTLLVLLPSLYFVLIFWPAIGGGKRYGNLPNQENLAIELNSYYPKLAPGAPMLAQKPEMLHPDYELLYQPSNREIQKAFRSGRLPLYNMHRLLGTMLWGSPVADAANPLTLFLFLFSPEQVHLIKIYVYTMLAFLGVYLCATVIFGAAAMPGFIGASIYVLNPFVYYMYHWASLYGVISLVPLLFLLVHLSVAKPRFLYLALVQVLFAWILLINQLQVLLYFGLFLIVWIVAGVAAKFYDVKTLLDRAPILAASFAGGAAFSLGYTWYLVQAGSALARQPHTYQEFSTFWPRLLGMRMLVELWGNQAPLDYWHYDSTMVFFPIAVLGVIFALCFGARRNITRIQAALGIVLWLLTIHCFLYPLHYPIYLLHIPLYNLNWEHWRVVYLFYFALALVAAFSITVLSGDAKVERRKFFALLFTGGAALYVLSSVVNATNPAGHVVLPLTAAAALAVLGHGFRRRLSPGHVAALGVCIVAACLYLPMTRVPFYDPSGVQGGSAGVHRPSDAARTMRLVSLDDISQPRGEYLWFNDSVMAMFSRNGATGYDTALQQREADLFATFYSPDLRRLRALQPLLKHGVQSSIVWPEAEGVLTRGDTLGTVNLARLELLGVGHLLWKRRIVNLGEPRWDSVFQLWDHPLPNPSPASLLRDTNAADVARLFSDSADDSLANRILRQRQAAPIDFSEQSGDFRSNLPAGSGLVVVSYNVARFYRPFVDGSPVPLESTNLPFFMLRKQSEEPVTLDLRPHTSGIWIITSVGLLLGLLIMAVIEWRSGASTDGGSAPELGGLVQDGFDELRRDRKIAVETIR